MASKLEEFIAEEVSRRWEEGKNTENDGFCEIDSVNWDISYEKFSNEITNDVLAVAKDKKQAEITLNAIFGKLKYVCNDTWGDHHIGYHASFVIDTTEARELASSQDVLREIINKNYTEEGVKTSAQGD